MSGGFTYKKKDDVRPVIRIWAPDAAVEPTQNETMQKLGDNLAHIEKLLGENRIADADFTPPVSRGSAGVDKDVHYEMHSPPPAPFITEAHRNIQQGIYERTGLVGGMRKMLSAGEREMLRARENLSVRWSLNTEKGREYGK